MTTTGIPTYDHARTSSRLVAGLAGAALALGVAAPVPSASAAGVGSIAGTVTNGDTPLAGIEVKVYDLDPWAGDVLVGEGVTDVNGAYDVEGIEADPYYKVQFSDPTGEWATEYYDDSITPTGGGAPFAQWVGVEADATTEDIDASLEPGGTISGRLTVGAGTPVEFGTVSLWWNYAPQAYTRVGEFETDEDGHYEIPGVKSATYALEFRDPQTGAKEAWNDKSGIFGSTPLFVDVGEEHFAIDALLGGVVKSTTAPTITGTPQVGQTLTASSGWSPADAAVTYRWIVGDDTNPADDPTGATYVPTAKDLGRTIRVHATGTRNAGWVPASAMSAATAPVAAAPPAPPAPVLTFANDRLPKIKGKLRVGKVVTVTKGAWTPSPTELTYTWFAGKQVFKKGRRQWVKLTKKQAGKRLRVEVTVSAPSYADTVVRTKRTDKVKR